MKIGERLKKLRKRLGLTQREFAERVHGDVGPSWIGKIERGQSSPSFQMLERIAKTFSVPLSYFFEDDDFLLSLVLNHPITRRIISLFMIIGNAGMMAVIAGKAALELP